MGKCGRKPGSQVQCSCCRGHGHNKRTCPERKHNNPSAFKNDHRYIATSSRRCSFCQKTGHNARTCAERKEAIQRHLEFNREWRSKVADAFDSIGLGLGALIAKHGRDPKSGTNGTCVVGLYMVKSIDWSKLVFCIDRSFTHEAIEGVPFPKFFKEGMPRNASGLRANFRCAIKTELVTKPRKTNYGYRKDSVERLLPAPDICDAEALKEWAEFNIVSKAPVSCLWRRSSAEHHAWINDDAPKGFEYLVDASSISYEEWEHKQQLKEQARQDRAARKAEIQ